MFIEAKNKTIAHRERVDYIVLHTMEVPLSPGMALRVATNFARGNRAVSAHYCIDPVQVVQCVHETDVAWHCPGCNRRGIGIEHAGYADRTDWSAPDAQAMLRLSADVAAKACNRWNIPVVHLTAAHLKAGERGFVGHLDATEAFETPGGHRDPGQRWPWDAYLQMVRAALA